MARLRIMTFNVRGNTVRDGINQWPARAAQAVGLIRKYRPDVIGFQELQAVHWDTFVAELPEYGRESGPKVDNGEPFAYPAIFWNPDRLHLLRRGRMYLSKTPEKFSGDWGTNCIRGAAWAVLRLNEMSHPPLLFLNTHLDHKSAEARAGQAGVLIEQAALLRTPGQPVFVTGDFNCQPGSPPYSQIQAAGFQDTWRVAGQAEGLAAGTFHQYTGAALASHGRIDWIQFLPGQLTVEVLSCAVLQDGIPPVYPSDHFPVLADLRLSGG